MTKTPKIISILVLLISLLLYIFTLCPTISWGDSPYFAYQTKYLPLSIGVNDHPLYFLLAKIVNSLLPGKTITKINLLTSLFSALTIAFLFLITFQLTKSNIASLISTSAFALSHTFWFNSVIAEIYSLNTLILALIILLAVKMENSITDKKKLRKYILLIPFLFGLALDNYILSLFFLPALLFLFISHRDKIEKKDLSLSLIMFLMGFSLFIILFIIKSSEFGFLNSVNKALGKKDQHKLFAAGFFGFFKEIGNYFLYLVYQFPGPAFIFGMFGFFYLLKFNRRITLFLFILCLFPNLYVFNYQTNHRFVHYIPSYLVFSIFIGFGFNELYKRHIKGKFVSIKKPRLINIKEKAISLFKKRTKEESKFVLIASLITIIIFPPISYWFTYRICEKYDIELFKARTAPYRSNYKYFLYPPKKGYNGTLIFANETFETVDRNSIIIADWTLFTSLNYLQKVEKRREDLILVSLSTSKPESLVKLYSEKFPERTIYFADNEHFYRSKVILRKYYLVPEGPIYRLVKKL